MSARRVTLLTWSPRVAPGLLSVEAWDLVRSADVVHVVGEHHPLLPSLLHAGAPADVLTEPVDVRALVDGARKAAVVVVPRADGDLELLADLRTDAAVADGAVELVVVRGSHDLPGAGVLDLVAVMDRLRSPGGCSWDAEQTHRSLVTYLVEETYETVESIESDDLVGLREELGDLLLQVVFHARIGEEHTSEPWSLDDVARGITDKLVRRHPHVFGDEPDATAEELEGRWDKLKAAEKGRTSAVDGVPLGQPALSLAAKLHDRASRAGVAPDVATDGVPVVVDEEALGELLLAVVVLARRTGLDPEAALRHAVRRYSEAIRAAE